MSISKKIVLLGHFGVGKTSLIRRFVENSFSENYKVSIGVHITKKVVTLDNKEVVSLILWDLEGTDDLKNIRDSYLLGTHAILYVFDVSRPITFQNIEADLAILKTKSKDATIKVVGNKLDLVIEKEAISTLNKHQINYNHLTSAKSGEQVDILFEELAQMLAVNA